jgi:hypothetical protein
MCYSAQFCLGVGYGSRCGIGDPHGLRGFFLLRFADRRIRIKLFRKGQNVEHGYGMLIGSWRGCRCNHGSVGSDSLPRTMAQF